MIEHLIYACVLILIQAWILPAVFNTNNVKWMLSNRDENPDTPKGSTMIFFRKIAFFLADRFRRIRDMDYAFCAD